MQHHHYSQNAEQVRSQENDMDSPATDPLRSPSPSPSPALSAYSYSSSASSTDDFSDQDPDLNALSLEAIEEPRYHLTASQSPIQGQFSRAPGPNWSDIDPRQSSLPSGAATPIASQSSASLRNIETFRATSSSPTGANLSAFSSLYRGQSPRQSSEDSTSSSHHTSIVDAKIGISPKQQHSPVDSEEDRIDRDVEADGFDALDVDEEDMHADGIPAARGWRLDARQADTLPFRSKVLQLFSAELRLHGWTQETVDPSLWPLQPDQLKLKRISGAFTNAVFFASYQPSNSQGLTAAPPTVLLRIYGASSEALLSRRAELLILHTLSSLYEIGPHILGTFANGRVEEFYDCDPIQKEGMRDFGDREAYMLPGGSLVVKGREGRAHWVARRMNELHSVPLEVMRTVLEQGNLRGPSHKGFGRGIENHIMASSHRPRRKTRTRYTAGLPDNKDASSSQMYGLDSRGLMRASPAPMASGEPSPAGSIEIQGRNAYTHRNSSAVSLDSLATSYNSQSSLFGDGPALTGATSPTLATSPNHDNSRSYFPPVISGPTSPLALAPQVRSSQKHKSSRGPYPGVWRRLKRWSREAAKVVELVDTFAKTESGAKAIAMCFASHPTIRQELQASPSALSTATIGPTPGNLRNTLRAIRAIDLVSLYREVEEFKLFVRKWERREGPSRRVFAHNDAQYGNLLAIKHINSTAAVKAAQNEQGSRDARSPSIEGLSIPAGMPRTTSHETRRDSATSVAGAQSPFATQKNRNRASFKKPLPLHHRIVVIDFEYASPNPRGYDIANHFQEWRADYHHPTLSWSLTHHGSYPDTQQRRKWLRAYVEQGRLLRIGGRASKGGPAAVDVPGDVELPPAVASLQYPAPGTAIHGPITTERSSAPATPGTGAAQIAALEKSLGQRDRPSLSQKNSNGSSTSSTSGRGSILGPSLNDGEADGLNKARGRRGSNDSISSSSWQAPPSGSLRAVNASAPSTPANCLGPASPFMEGSASPQVLALATLDASIEKEIDRLDREVQLWSPATHAVWGLWGIVFAKEELEAVLSKAQAEAEGQAVEETVLCETSTHTMPSAACAVAFDNLRYALGRIELFRQEFHELKQMGVDAI